MIPLCERTRELFRPTPVEYFNDTDRVTIGLASENRLVIDAYNLVSSHNSTARYRASAALRRALDRIPEQVAMKEDVGYFAPRLVGATDITVELIDALIPAKHVSFEDDATSEVYYGILTRSRLADTCAVTAAEFKLNKSVPAHNFELNAQKPLAPYQQVALCLQQRSAGYGLFMEQGTGKTPVAIAGVCNGAIRHREENRAGMHKSIIVCPNNLCQNWLTEFHKFATRPGRVTILRGTQLQRVKLLCDAFAPPEDGEDPYYSVIIVGYKMLWKTWESLRLFPWDIGILDEAHAITNVKATQSKYCIELRDNCAQRIVLTGTPMEQSILHVYNILEFMEPGGSGFSSNQAFRKYYGQFDITDGGHEVLVGTKNIPILQERLARKSYFISKKEALPDLPEKVYDIISVEMGPNQQTAYNKLQRELAVSIEAQLANSTLQRSMVVQNILTQLLRLSQITSGFLSYDEIRDLDGSVLQPKFYEYFDPNPKIDAVVELLQGKSANDKTLIWANWIPDIEYLASVCEHLDIGHCVFRGLHAGYTEEDRQEAVRRFNEDPECKVFIGTPASGGAGLNLLGYPPGEPEGYGTNCTHVIYYSQDWSAIKRAQSEDRAHRRGTRVTVRFTTIVCESSIDEQIDARVAGKRTTALSASDLSNILSAALNI